MYADRPHILPLSYTRFMMAALLYQPNFQRVCILGLGAGSLYHFLHHHYYCRIDAVEIRQRVIDTAIRYFRVPTNDANLTLHHQSAEAFLAKRRPAYDLIFVDLYDDQGMADAILHRQFYSQLAAAVSPTAVVSLNLWASQTESFKQVLTEVQACFPHTQLLPVPNKGNVIVLASLQPWATDQAALALRAQSLEDTTGVEFCQILQLLRDAA